MPEQAELLDTITSVGGDVYRELSSEALALDDIEDWLTTYGIDRADNPVRVLSNLTAYDQLLKATLYGHHQLHADSLEPLITTENLGDRFDVAFRITGDAAFERYMLDRVAESAGFDLFQPLLNVRHQLMNSATPTDEIGRLFEEIVPQHSRRKLGQFRTPEQVGELMAGWVVNAGTETVLDPGVGAGVLSAQVYEEKISTTGESEVSDLYGVDLSEMAVVMTSCALQLVNGDGTPHLHRKDFMDMAAEGENARLTQEGLKMLPKVDAVVSNPPYSRHHELTASEKNRINAIAQAEAAMEISKRAPMYHYFYVHAAQFLRDKGRMSFVTPSEFLETNYGEQLKQFLLDTFAVHGLVMYDTSIEVFDNATTTSCISFLERQPHASEDMTTTFVKLSKWPGVEKIRSALSGDVVGETDWGYINHVPQSELSAKMKWTQFTNPDSVDSIPGLKAFGEIADVNRGIATGNNGFFCLSKEQINERGIPELYLQPLIRRAQGLDSYELRDEDWQTWRDAGQDVYLLYLYDENGIIRDVQDENVAEYLEYGQEIGADDGYLTQSRHPWYRVDQRDPPDMLVTYMSNNGFKFIHNDASVLSLNNLHNIYLKEHKEYTRRQKRALLAYLNSDIANEIIARSGRSYSDNLKKIEPNELEQVPVVDPDTLSTDDIATLDRYFVDICEVARTGEVPLSEAQSELNEKVAEVLGI